MSDQDLIFAPVAEKIRRVRKRKQEARRQTRNRTKRVPKPKPKGREALVKKQKKNRPKIDV